VAQPPSKSDRNKPSGDGGAPTPSAEDEILIREIDEAVRQDDAAQFMQKYGPTLAIVIVVFLAGFGGWLYWQSREEAALETQSERIITAMDAVDGGDFEAAAERVDPLVEEGTPGARAAALFVQAASALEQDETERAVEIYAMIAADESLPAELRDLARIREVASNFDEREPQAVIDRLAPLAQPGSAFFGSAAELTAIAHLELGNRDEAGQLFAQIAKDEDLPDTLTRRAQQMAGLLGVDAIEDVDELLREEGVLPASGSSTGAQ